MARVAEYLKDEPIAAIYSSPRRRASESAEILSTRGGGAPVLKDHARASSLAGHGPAPRGMAGHGLAPRGMARHGPTPPDIVLIPDLREIDFGDFEGLSYDEIAARYPELYRQWMDAPTEVRFPNGERFCEMRKRVVGAFDAIERKRRGQTVAIVSHGGVNRILIAWALQIPDQYLFRVAQDYAAVNLLEIADGSPSVKLVNHRVTSAC